MKIIIHGPLAGYGWDGTIHSWAPDTLVELDDSNPKQVAWGKAWLGMGATLVEDVAAEEPTLAEPTLAELRAQAEARGLPTYGSKAQLQERLASK